MAISGGQMPFDRPAPRTVAEMFAGGGCQFISGDIHAEHTFCGEPRHKVPVPGGMRKLPFCAAHTARCYKKAPKRPGEGAVR